jgi:hypothetical protein
VPCREGTYQPKPMQFSMRSLASMQYHWNTGEPVWSGSCIPCPAGKVATPGSAYCKCPEGYARSHDGPCILCGEGFYSRSQGNNTVCDACPKGTARLQRLDMCASAGCRLPDKHLPGDNCFLGDNFPGDNLLRDFHRDHSPGEGYGCNSHPLQNGQLTHLQDINAPLRVAAQHKINSTGPVMIRCLLMSR